MATLQASDLPSPKKLFVNQKLLPLITLIAFTFLVLAACKKLNESTTLGDDVIPGVDGVTTFDTSLSVEAFNNLFNPGNDSFAVSRAEDHILGTITNDPIFGKSTASIYLQLRPPFYKYTFANLPDSLTLDSVVLVLGYHNTYGDSTVKQRVRVFEIDPSNIFRADSGYQLHQPYFTLGGQLGQKEFFPYELNDSVKAYQDTTVNQLRIRLSDSFGNLLLDKDSSNAYATDSAFNAFFRGFAVITDSAFGGNALMSFGLSNEPNTKLAIYYKYIKNAQVDTTVSYFTFTGSSAEHNYITRDYTGTQIPAAMGGGNVPDPIIYLQNTPGTYATLRVPGLRNLSNRIVHRAELIVEQLYDVSDKTFPPPIALYLDLFDSSLMKYKTTPYDFVPESQGIYLFNYGLYGRQATDPGGNLIRRWTFNLSRYVQNVVTKKEPTHDMRLLAHRYVFDQIRENNFTNTGSFASFQVGINPVLAFGRVRVGGGNHPTQRMRLRIIYSKI